MTITIDLPKPILDPLEQLAQSRGCTVEDVARSAITQYIQSHAARTLDPALAQVVADSFAENDELYRRLAR